jgi:plasmid stabilization system protein ParE
MSRTLRIVERARSDVDDIFHWLVARSVQGAIFWYLAFRHAIEKIASSPKSFAEAAESYPLGRQFRQAPFKTRRGRDYRIVFEVSDTEIIVLRVRGPGQRPLRPRDLPGQGILTLRQNSGAPDKP